jgi:heme/copper-type cytochrome/quinol oxidase subunit 2
MNRISLAKKAVALPLIGLLAAWLAFMGAALANLYVPQPIYNNVGVATFPEEIVQIAPYLFLLGIAAVAFASLISKRWAQRSKLELGENHKLSRAALRFANLGIVLALAAGAVFAIGNFLGAFNTYSGRAENPWLRFLSVYVPILLATGLVVYVLLAAFVFNHEDEKHTDGSKAKMTDAQKALGLGYAIPILATALAIIFGLGVYDVTRTNLQVWIWVIIIAIVATGVVFGTRFANKARAAKPAPVKPRTALAAGASNLNFVLSIIFGATVTVMAFGFGTDAIGKLQTWSNPPVDCVDIECNSISSVSLPSLQWLLEDLAPAKVLLLLAVIGIYVTITERNKEAEPAKKAPAKKAK